jgi:hypothetical protein
MIQISLQKTIQKTAFAAAATVVFLSAFSPVVIAGGNNGSVKTVSDCSHVNDNQFNEGTMVKGRGDNFDEDADYQWTITKVDHPGQGTQTASGSFHLNAGETTYCIDLGNAVTVSNDSHSEFRWEVEEKEVSKNGSVSWKKVDSDNFYVDSVAIAPTSQPTVVPTSIPTVTSVPSTVTPTVTPVVTQIVTPSVTPTNAPTNAPTTTPAQDILSSGASTNNTQGQVQGVSYTYTLGASTMADTGNFENSVMQAMFAAGMMVVGLGALSYAKEKSA